jgi:heme exporter protein C
MMIAYFVLRNSIEEDERRGVYAAVFAVLAAVNAPISFLITRIIPSNHPVVFKSGMASSNLLPFIIGQLGMLALGYGIYVARMSEERLRERVELAKEALEG